MARELQPVFDELAEVQRRCADIRAAAAAQARVRRDRGREEARAIVAAAGLDAAVQRADAAARVRREAEQESAATIASGERAAVEIRHRVEERLDEFVSRVVAAVEAVGAEPGRVP